MIYAVIMDEPMVSIVMRHNMEEKEVRKRRLIGAPVPKEIMSMAEFKEFAHTYNEEITIAEPAENLSKHIKQVTEEVENMHNIKVICMELQKKLIYIVGKEEIMKVYDIIVDNIKKYSDEEVEYCNIVSRELNMNIGYLREMHNIIISYYTRSESGAIKTVGVNGYARKRIRVIGNEASKISINVKECYKYISKCAIQLYRECGALVVAWEGDEGAYTILYRVTDYGKMQDAVRKCLKEVTICNTQ